jgi:5'-3' exonuclease
LDCIPGNHYNPRTKSLYQVSEEYAERFYWKQILTGDSVDNIPGLPKVGPVKAEKILGNEKTPNGLQNLVCRAYHDIYGDQGYKYLITNGRLIHIWRYLNDHFKIKEEVYAKAIK